MKEVSVYIIIRKDGLLLSESHTIFVMMSFSLPLSL